MNTKEEIAKVEKTIDEKYTGRLRKIVLVYEAQKALKELTIKDFVDYFDVTPNTFNTTILHPLREHLTKEIHGVTPERAKEIWAKGASNEDKKLREAVSDRLPRMTRKRNKTEFTLDGIITLERDN